MTATQPIIILPLDARPVCYQLVKQLAHIGDFRILLPPAEQLGHLKKAANLEFIDTWLSATLKDYPDSPVILSADMLLYGGLIAGRVNEYTYEKLKTRLEHWLVKLQETKRKVIIFSTILRIPNYNNDEEEPHYWQTYGKQLYEASEKAHRTNDITNAFSAIPESIRTDFFARRKLHHQINLLLIDTYKSKRIDYLTISQDDTGEFGLNVEEAQQYEKIATQNNLLLIIQTGADELVATSLSRLLCEQFNQHPKLFVHYDPEACKNTLAKFDGRTIETVIESQVTATGGKLTQQCEEASLILWVHGPKTPMGDHCENNSQSHVTEVNIIAERLSKSPTIIVDIANANGSDREWIKELLEMKLDWTNLYGYAGWNTPGNSVGSAIAMGVLTYLAKDKNCFQKIHWAEALLTRFLDDWVYQAICRTQLRTTQQTPDNHILNQMMQPYSALLVPLFQMAKKTCAVFSFPCQRFFEIEVTLL